MSTTNRRIRCSATTERKTITGVRFRKAATKSPRRPFWESDAAGGAGAPLTISFSIAGVADPQLGQVGGVQVSAVVEGLTVSWNAVAAADGYKVQWRTGTEEFSAGRERSISGGNVTQYTIEGLEAGMEYEVRVIATRTGVADAEPSAVAQGTARAHPPGRVPWVEVSEEVERLVVSWAAVGDADGYKVRWWPTADPLIPQHQEVIESGATTSFTIVGINGRHRIRRSGDRYQGPRRRWAAVGYRDRRAAGARPGAADQR